MMIVNVTDAPFSAAMDGVTDDLVAINSALSACSYVHFPQGTYRVSAMPDFNGHALQAHGAILIVDDVQQNIGQEINLSDAGGIKIEGKNVHAVNLTAVVSVTGSAGAYDVTATLDDVSNISVGDVAMVRNVVPGVCDPTLSTTHPAPGALEIGYFKSSYLNTAGTAVTFSAGNATNHIAAGDLLITRGQVRRFTSVSTLSAVIDAAFLGNIVNMEYWYTMKPAAGTISASGTAVTGVGTSFLTTANPGDLLVANGHGVGIIASISSNTVLTLVASMGTITAKNFGVIVQGEMHEGAWKITAINGNNVTWRNTVQSAIGKPPVNLVSAAEVTVIKTVLQAGSSMNGAVVCHGTLRMDKIALIGAGDSTTEAIALVDGVATAILGNDVAIMSFGYGAKISYSSVLQAAGAMFCGNVTRGVEVNKGARLFAREAVINGNAGVGAYISHGCYGDLNTARMSGNGQPGLRLEVGSSVAAEFAFLNANNSNGMYLVGANCSHLVAARVSRNNGIGIQMTNGGFGRASGSIFLANYGDDINTAQSNLEAVKMCALGNMGSGIIINRGQFSMAQGGSGFAIGGHGLRAINSHCHVDTAHFTGSAKGIRSEDGARVFGFSTVVSGNVANLDEITAELAVIKLY